MMFEDMPDGWQEWLALTPIERFRESGKIFAQYLAIIRNDNEETFKLLSIEDLVQAKKTQREKDWPALRSHAPVFQ